MDHTDLPRTEGPRLVAGERFLGRRHGVLAARPGDSSVAEWA
jgi:hypothetical protein